MTARTCDAAFNPVPLLAETHAIADGGGRHTITLRRGVRFHNGKEMTAADVVPVAHVGHARAGIRFRPDRRTPPSPA